MIEHGKSITYHRHCLFETDLIKDASNRTMPYQIARGIWKHFFPIHLARIQSALRRQQKSCLGIFHRTILLLKRTQQAEHPLLHLRDDPSIVRLHEQNARLLNSMLETAGASSSNNYSSRKRRLVSTKRKLISSRLCQSVGCRSNEICSSDRCRSRKRKLVSSGLCQSVS